jgi:zinc/manganese transport system substrate-binding protein
MNFMVSRRICLGLIGAALIIAPGLARAETAKAVASFSILADLVRQVGGDRVEVASLVGPDADAHAFSPSPADANRIASANIIVVNGLGFEGWMDRLVKASGTKAPVVVASRGIAPIESEDEHGGHGRHRDDPHAWQSIANVRLYVANIRDGLIAADPPGRETYTANASRYLAELDRLEAEVKAAVARIPASRRRIITTHDAFGYFARAYGMTFIAPQGVSTDAEASAKDVARIIRQIRAEKIPAVFLENVSDPRLMDRIAKETGARIGGKLYSDALSPPDGPAATYLDMMRNNMRAFDAALAV